MLGYCVAQHVAKDCPHCATALAKAVAQCWPALDARASSPGFNYGSLTRRSNVREFLKSMDVSAFARLLNRAIPVITILNSKNMSIVTSDARFCYRYSNGSRYALSGATGMTASAHLVFSFHTPSRVNLTASVIYTPKCKCGPVA